jgi:hypothetical protein
MSGVLVLGVDDFIAGGRAGHGLALSREGFDLSFARARPLAFAIALFDFLLVPIPISVNPHGFRQNACCDPAINRFIDDAVPLL